MSSYPALMRDSTAKRLSAFHTLLFRSTKGKLGKRLVDNDMLLLTTTGSKTGISHTVPLLYLLDGEDIIVIASWGGRPNNPDWYGNLSAQPGCEVQILGRKFSVQAVTAEPTERERLWTLITAAYDGYREYQSRTTREIPVIVLRET